MAIGQVFLDRPDAELLADFLKDVPIGGPLAVARDKLLQAVRMVPFALARQHTWTSVHALCGIGKIAAIKVYKRSAKVDLKTGKEAVEAMEQDELVAVPPDFLRWAEENLIDVDGVPLYQTTQDGSPFRVRLLKDADPQPEDGGVLYPHDKKALFETSQMNGLTPDQARDAVARLHEGKWVLINKSLLTDLRRRLPDHQIHLLDAITGEVLDPQDAVL